MNQSEEMVALKKVYADMILNTTKESAVRVMAAESKAHRYEKELASTKEEAVRLLLRLKHMMDTQKKEAEARSLNDQNRINELEAQLDEAEGMIIDLRAKVNNVEDQLESLKDKYKRLSSRKEIIYLPTHSKTPMDTQSYPAFPYSLNVVSEPTPVISEIPVLVPKPSILVHEGITSQKDIPITIESKEPEVYDNGGCERVEESETISLPKPSICDHGSMTSSKEVIKPSSGCHSGSVNNSVSASANIESNELYEKEECIEQSVAIETSLPDEKMQTEDEESEPKPKKYRRNAKTKSLSCLRSEKCGMKDSLRNDISSKDQHGRFHKLPRRTIRYGRVKTVSSKRRSAKIMTSATFTRCRSSVSRNAAKISDDTSNFESGLKEKLQQQPNKKYDNTASFVRRSIRKRKMKNWDTPVKASNNIDCPNVEDDLSTAHEGISVKEAIFNADTLENSAYGGGDSLEDESNLIDVVIVEQPNRLASMTLDGRIHVKEEFVNAEKSACSGGNLFDDDDDDANLVDVVITEDPNGGLGSHMKLHNTCSVPEHEENDGNLVDVVILEPPNNNGVASCTVLPVDCKIAEKVNASRTIIHTFSRKRKNRSLAHPSEEEHSLKKQRGEGEGEGNDIVLTLANGDESYADSRISSMQVA